MSRLDDYREAWDAESRLHRAWERVRWWLDSVVCAVLGEAGPGERLLIHVWTDERKELCEECLKKATGGPPS